MTNIENLMQPRYKVMMDYPDSVYEVGIIIKFPEKSDWFTGEMDWCSEMVGRNGSKAMRSIKYFEPYPLIFKPLPWYADRDVSELPLYLKCGENGKPRKVKEYLTNWDEVIFEGGRQRKLNKNWIPITEEEFNTPWEPNKNNPPI